MPHGCELMRRLGLASVGLAALILAAAPDASAQSSGTVIRAGDAVVVTVATQESLTGKYIVDGDGAITLPLAGRVVADGLTPDRLGDELRRRLSEFLVDPQVRVDLQQARRVFVFGNVKAPGPLDLSEHMTLLEALTRAGYSGVAEVLVLRRDDARGPILIDDPAASVVRVNLVELEQDAADGRLDRNVVLAAGDTIYVPDVEASRVYVSGEVRKPGWYGIPEGTTVLQAISLAGGVTEQGSVGRLRILRMVEGDQEAVGAELVDRLEPGDTLVVPEKFALSVLQFGPSDPERRREREIRFGRAFSIVPVAALTRIGIDTNVLNETGRPEADFVVSGGPQLDVWFDLRRVRLGSTGGAEFVYFRDHDDQRSVNRWVSGTTDLELSRRFTMRFGAGWANSRERLNNELDARLRRIERTLDAGLQFRPWDRVQIEVAGRDFHRRFDRGVTFFGVKVDETLTGRLRIASAATRVSLTALTSLEVAGRAATHRFDLFPEKNADTTEMSVGGTWRPGALVAGAARVGYLRHLSVAPTAPDLERVVGGFDLSYQPGERTRLGGQLERTTGDTFQPQFAFALVDRAGGFVQQGMFRRFDIRLEAYREAYTYQVFRDFDEGAEGGLRMERTRRYTSELGVHAGALRVGFNATYVERFATTRADRSYDSIWLTANITYGAVDVRSQ